MLSYYSIRCIFFVGSSLVGRSLKKILILTVIRFSDLHSAFNHCIEKINACNNYSLQFILMTSVRPNRCVAFHAVIMIYDNDVNVMSPCAGVLPYCPTVLIQQK